MSVKLNSVYNNILICSLIVCAVSAVAINPGQIRSNLGTSADDVKIQKNNLDSKKNSDTELSNKENNVVVNSTSNKTKIDIKDSLPLYKLFKDCKENSTCFEGGVIQLIDNMDNKSIPLYQDMIFLEKTSGESPTGSDASETLMKRFDRFLRDHSIRVRIPNLKSEVPNLLQELLPTDYADISLRSLATTDASEGRGRLRIIRSFIVFIILFMEVVYGVLVPVILFNIKIMGLKGLWAGVMSVIMTVAIGLKALLSTNNGNDQPRRGRLKKLGWPLHLFMELMAFVLTPISFAAILLLNYKGLVVGMSALTVAGFLGWNALFSNSDNPSPSTRFSLGYVKPHHVPEIWNRNSESFYSDMPYRGYYQGQWTRPT